ncbi:hypothetical protein [Rothia amarae]|uniref:hypothetical protein n=1 Tax=Rothia amarae TaxID=169480 RepID=UPI0012463EA9
MVVAVAICAVADGQARCLRGYGARSPTSGGCSEVLIYILGGGWLMGGMSEQEFGFDDELSEREQQLLWLSDDFEENFAGMSRAEFRRRLKGERGSERRSIKRERRWQRGELRRRYLYAVRQQVFDSFLDNDSLDDESRFAPLVAWMEGSKVRLALMGALAIFVAFIGVLLVWLLLGTFAGSAADPQWVDASGSANVRVVL